MADFPVDVSETVSVSGNLLDEKGTSDTGSDTVTTSEDLGGVYRAVVDKSEIVTASEALSESYGTADVGSDTVTASEALVDVYGSTLAGSETVTVSESLEDFFEGTDAASETITVSEALSDLFNGTDAASETVTASEALSESYGTADVGSDTVTASESLEDFFEGTDAASETITVSEALSDLFNGTDAASEIVTSSEALSESYGTADAASETVTASEALADVYGATLAGPETVTASESLGDFFEGTDAASETVTASEALSDLFNGTDAASETVTASEALSESYGTADVGPDTVTSSEALVDAYGATLVGSETVTVSEALSNLFNGTDAASETVTASEALSNLFNGTDAASETVTASEALSNLFNGTDAASEIVTSSEALSESYGTADAASETVTASEALSESYGTADAASETVTASETLADAYGATLAGPETVTASESLEDFFEGTDAASETITVSEALSDLFNGTDAASEIVTSSEAMSDSYGTANVGSETVTASESLADAYGATLVGSETVTASESLDGVYAVTIGSLPETVSVSDSTTVGKVASVNMPENVSVSEMMGVAESIHFDESVSISDDTARRYGYKVHGGEPVTLVESRAVGKGDTRNVGDTISVSDSVAEDLELVNFISDSVTVSDSVWSRAAKTRSVSETIPITETVMRDAVIAFLQPVPIFEAQTQHAVMTSQVSELVGVYDYVDATKNNECRGNKDQQPFRLGLHDELSWSPRGQSSSFMNLRFESVDGGVPLRVLEVEREYTTYQTGNSGYLMVEEFEVVPNDANLGLSHLFSFPGDAEYLGYDPVGRYLEITTGHNQGIYKITGLRNSTGPIVLELDRFLPIMDPSNGYVQGILELAGSYTEGLSIVEYQFKPTKVTLEDPLLEIVSYDFRGEPISGELAISTTPNILEFRPDLPLTFDPTRTSIFAIARVSPKVDWRLISGITNLSVLTTKPTAGKSYRISAESVLTSDGRYVDITGYTLIRLSDIQPPRVIWAGPVGDDGTVLVQFDQPMQTDVDNLFNPSDYVITGSTPVEVTRVYAYNATTVALTTTGFSSGDYTLTVSTNTPKDLAGNPLDPTYNTVIFTASPPLTLRSIFTDKGPIAKPPLTLLSGVTATISSFTGVTLTGATLTSSHVGKYLTITGASSNAGTFRITAVLSATQARVQASFTLPDATVFSWEVFDPRDGLMADDPSDVTVRINGTPVTPEAVIGLLGQIVLNAAPAETDDVKVDYSWCCNPTVDFRRLNSKEFRLNAWNRDQGYPRDGSQHHYRYNNVLVRPADYQPLDPRAILDQPEQRELHYRAYERAYTPVLNDPSTLVLNSPIHRIAYPPSQRYLSEEYVTYEGLSLPESLTVNPWTRRGSGTASVAGGYLTIKDDTSGPFPNGNPIFWTRLIDLTFPLVFAMSWRFRLDTLTELDGIFSGIAAGYSDDKVAVVVGFLEDSGVKKIGILKRAYGDDPSSLAAWIGGLDSLGSATGLPADFDWTDLHSYRILKDRNGVIRVYVDGDLDPILQVLPDDVPFLEELNAPFDEIQGAFFGSLSRPARSISKWDFVRYLIQPTNSSQTSASSFVSYEANVVPEADAKPWALVGFHGTETILSTDFLLLDSTSASDAAGVGLIGGDYRGYFRFEPLLTVSSEVVVDAKLQGITQTHGISPNGLMFAVDDGSRLMQVCFLLDRDAPKISYGGRSFPEDFTPYMWSSMGNQTADMAGRVLRITDTSGIDGLVYYYDDSYPAGSAERVVASAIDYILEFRCRVISYTADVSGFAGAFGQVFDGSRSVGLLLREVAGVKYATFHSDGVMLVDAVFDWGDDAPHTYRLTKSTSGDLVSLFIDGQFVDSLAYSSFAATGPSTTGQITFGSSTPASNAAQSVVDWYYCNAWRLLSGLRSYVGIWKGTNTSTLLDYHLPIKVTGQDATAVANALGDGGAAFLSAGVVPGDLLIVDDGPNSGVYEVDVVTSETSLTLTAAWAQQPTLVTYRIARETDWSTQHKYRLTRDSQGNVALLLDAVTSPIIRVGYNSIDLPSSGASGIRIISGGLPAIVFGAFDGSNLSQSNWDYVRYGLTRAPNELRIVPHHEVQNQWNVMHSPERLFTQLAHTLTDFKSSSTGQPPKTDPDFLANPALEAFTKLNEGTPIVPLTQTFEVRAPYPTTEFISALNRPEDVLNSDADFTLNDASVRYKLIVPKDILYSSLDIIEQTTGETGLIAPFTDGCFCMPDMKLEYTKEVCLTYDGDVLPEDDTVAPTPWHLVKDDPAQVTTSVFGGVLTFSTNAGGTKAAYLNNTPLPDSPSLRTEAQFRMRVLADGTLGTGDTQIRAGLSAPGVTVALAFITTAWAERFILVMDLNNGNVLGSITFDFLDGAYHTYRIVRDPGAGVVQVAIDI